MKSKYFLETLSFCHTCHRRGLCELFTSNGFSDWVGGMRYLINAYSILSWKQLKTLTYQKLLGYGNLFTKSMIDAIDLYEKLVSERNNSKRKSNDFFKGFNKLYRK